MGVREKYMKVKKWKRRPLMSHQADYLEFANKRNHNACLMEMRLGRRLQQYGGL